MNRAGQGRGTTVPWPLLRSFLSKDIRLVLSYYEVAPPVPLAADESTGKLALVANPWRGTVNCKTHTQVGWASWLSFKSLSATSKYRSAAPWSVSRKKPFACALAKGGPSTFSRP